MEVLRVISQSSGIETCIFIGFYLKLLLPKLCIHFSRIIIHEAIHHKRAKYNTLKEEIIYFTHIS
uniref:Fatty acid hydroxylase domain-containing protein n=1 Tax=Parascaris equorum TaxID=6256 RepID=A0A914RML0_PAREQ